MIHHVKITEPFFTDVRTGAKTFEIRKNDRNYMVGDMIELMRFVDGELTGESVYVDIVYMIDDYAGLANGFCVMGIKRMPEPHVPEDEELERRNTRQPRFTEDEREALERASHIISEVTDYEPDLIARQTLINMLKGE